MLWKCITPYVRKFGHSGHRTGKDQFSFQSPKGNANECLNYNTISFIPHVSKIMLKILQDRLQQYMNWELPDGQAGFRKGRGTRNQIANIHWIIEKQDNSRKTSTSSSLTTLKPLTVWITTNCGKFFKRWEFQTTLPDSWEICMRVKKQRLKLDWFQIGKWIHQRLYIVTLLI